MTTFGERETKTCADYPGECCPSCHEDYGQGYNDLPEVESLDGKRLAVVCCKKYEAAKRDIDAPSITDLLAEEKR